MAIILNLTHQTYFVGLVTMKMAPSLDHQPKKEGKKERLFTDSTLMFLHVLRNIVFEIF